MAGARTRDAKLVIRMNAGMLEKVRSHSEGRGVTMSALAAWVLGDWVTQQERLQPLLDVVGQEMVKIAQSAMEKAAE